MLRNLRVIPPLLRTFPPLVPPFEKNERETLSGGIASLHLECANNNINFSLQAKIGLPSYQHAQEPTNKIDPKAAGPVNTPFEDSVSTTE